MTARTATIATPPGPFTVVVTDDDGRDVVLASGWTDDVADLLPVVHRSLRPASVELVADLPVLKAVEAFFAGDVTAIDDVVVRQRSGPFLQEAWEILRTVPAGHPDTYAAFAARSFRPHSDGPSDNVRRRPTGHGVRVSFHPALLASSPRWPAYRSYTRFISSTESKNPTT